ncbi:MAG: DUF4097 family beta strand repeat-containing protein, partial [Planctomycetota bacterium]
MMFHRAPIVRILAIAVLGIAGVFSTTSALALGESQRSDFSREFRKTVDLQAGQAVDITNEHGDVVIQTHPQSGVEIKADIRVSASSKERAARFGNEIRIEVDQSAGALRIRTRYPVGRRSGNISFSVDYEITMPETAPLTLKNRFGDVRVTNLKADADIDNGHGLLTFRGGRGTQKLKNSFGGVEVTENAGDVSV